MNKKITVLAAAVAMAIGTCAFADDSIVPPDYQWQEPQNANHVNGQWASGQYTYTNDDGSTHERPVNEPNDNNINITVNGNGGGAGNGSVFFNVTNSTDFINNGSLWINVKDTVDKNYYIQVITVSGNNIAATNSNEGKIYIDGTKSGGAGKFTAMSVEGNNSEITNKGLIYVKKATAMKANSNTSNSTVTNEGVIVVDDGGLGMVAGSKTPAGNNFVNNGAIYVADKDSSGVKLEDGASSNTFTNSGMIDASAGGYAINMQGVTGCNNNTIVLTGNSHISGKSILTGTTDLKVENLTSENEVFDFRVDMNEISESKSTSLNDVTLTNSKITFKNSDGSVTSKNSIALDNLTFEKGTGDDGKESVLGIADGTKLTINKKIDVASGEGTFEVSDLGQITLEENL